jgi:two-component system chemotaxis response regulator CheB
VSTPRVHPAGAGGTEACAAIVIGGSSGAIDALMALLPGLPAALRAAVLVVLHIPRERPSRLVEIFQPHCRLALSEAHDQEALAPGTLRFAPPDYHLLLDRGPRTALSVDPLVNHSRPSIDVLFESAADLLGERLVAIVLSGANDDGARGAAAVHEAGGLVIVQAPDSAAVPAMPQSALARVPTPHVLAPAAIAGLLTQLHHEGRL